MTEYELKTKAIKKFLKKGDEGDFSKLFDNLTDEIKGYWENKFRSHDEIPIFTYLKDEDNWALVTTRRLIWMDNAIEYNLKFSEIDRVDVNLRKYLSNGGRPGCLNLLQITANNQTFDLYTEIGAPFIGLLYMMNLLVTDQKLLS